MWNCFSQYYHESVEKYVPKYIPKKECKPKPQWMTADSLNSIKEKRHAWSKYYATKRKCVFEKYKRVRNQTNEVVRAAKRNFERKIAGKVKNESKHFWKNVRSKVKSQSSVTNLKRDDSSVTESDQEKAEVLNDFFASVFTREKSG